MRRAFRALALAVLLAACCATVASAVEVSIVNRINAIGLVDYAHKPTFKVGDYVRYRVTTESSAGNERSDYLLTVLIAGEEVFWGEKCFWLETWTDDLGNKKSAVASLMSYDIFNDSLANDRVQNYRRKIISGVDENGVPLEELTRSTANLRAIRSTPVGGMGFKADTVGVDTVVTPLGVLKATRVNIFSGKDATQSVGDSSVYLQNLENRSRWFTPAIPITHVAREDSRQTAGRQAWKVGYSRESGPMIIKEVSVVTSRVVEVGHGLKSRMLPASRSTSFAQQAAAARRAAAPRPGARR